MGEMGGGDEISLSPASYRLRHWARDLTLAQLDSAEFPR